MAQQKQLPNLTSEQSLSELHNLGSFILSNEFTNSKQLVNFISLYVQNLKYSEQFFLTLCEYNIVNRLCSLFKQQATSLQVLQSINLLLANTANTGQLVFIFSQSGLHQFLFDKFIIQKETPDSVQYYVQLLKTIIMKMSGNNHSLIKLFCNGRFPHFPLLSAVTTLGVDYDQEVLVRVTANQCFLLLIRIINQTHVGVQYLSELQAIVYYQELVRVFFAEGEEEQNELLRFIVDLVLSLRNNITSLAIFMNLLTNGMMFGQLGETQHILRFIIAFYEEMIAHTEFPNQLAEEIVLVLCRIVGKYYGSHNINYTYYTAQRVLRNLQVPERPNLNKFYQSRCKKIQQYLLAQKPQFQQQKELQFVWQQWCHFNLKNQTISPLKQRKTRSRNSFTDFFTSKDEFILDYVRAVMTQAGIACDKIDQPIYKLSYSTNYQTALYLVESVCLRFGKSEGGQLEQYCKDQMWQLKMGETVLVQLYKICRMLHKYQQESSQQSVSNNKQTLSKYIGFANLLSTIRPTISSAFVNMLSGHQSRIQIPRLCLISAISTRIRIGQSLKPEAVSSLMNKLREMQVYISEDVFSEQAFHFVVKYICKGRERTLLRRIDRPKECQSPLSPKKKFYHIRTRIESTFIQYQVIKRIIDPSLKSLSQFIEQYWQSRFFTNKGGQAYPIAQFLYKDSNGGVLEVMAVDNYEFAARKSKKDTQSVVYSIGKDDCGFDKENPTYLSFGDHQFFIDLQTEEKARNFREDLNRLRKEKNQLFMNGILEYLTFSYESLAAICDIRQSKLHIFSTPGYSK